MNFIAVLIALAIIIVAFKFNVFLGIAVAIVAIGVGIYNFLPTLLSLHSVSLVTTQVSSLTLTMTLKSLKTIRSLRLTKRVSVSLWKQLLSLVSRLIQNFTSVSAVNTAATHHQLSSATRLVLTMFHAHHSVCQSQDLQLLKLRLTKKTNSLSNMIIRQAKPKGFACFFV